MLSATWRIFGFLAVASLATLASAQVPTLQFDTWPDAGGSVTNTGSSATAGTIFNQTLITYPGPGPDDGSLTAPNVAIHIGDGGGALQAGINTSQSYGSLVGLDGSMTMSAWVNLDAATATTGDHMVFGADASNGQGLHLGFRGGDAYFGFWGNDSNATGGAPVGAWAHFTWVYDPSTGTQSIYENGALINASGGHSAYANGGNVWIGTDDFNNGSLMGSLDDVRIYNTAFNATQVAALYTDSSKPDLVPEPASLVLFGLGAIGLLAAGIRRRSA